MVTDDPSTAASEAAAGRRVVLVVPEGDAPSGVVPGSIAVLVGDLSEPAVRLAAEEMDRELDPPGH